MKIGIDISQLAYEGTGVATFLKQTVLHLIEQDKANTYVLFYSSLRNTFKRAYLSKNPLPANVTVKTFRFPPPVLDTVWNKLHIFPIENILGDLDVFISSDWTQPPTKIRGL